MDTLSSDHPQEGLAQPSLPAPTGREAVAVGVHSTGIVRAHVRAGASSPATTEGHEMAMNVTTRQTRPLYRVEYDVIPLFS
jgi:hypothetical protein